MNRRLGVVPWRCGVALGATLLLGGCVGLDQYQPEPVKVAASYAQPAAPQQQVVVDQRALASDPWWRVFADARLDRLVAQILARNDNLAAAGLALRKSRLQAGLAGTALWPDVGGTVSASGRRDLDTGSNSHGYDASLSLNWQLDLWGKLRAQHDAARWQARATAADLAATRLALIGDACDAYWQLAYLNLSIATGHDNRQRLQKMLTLTQVQRRAGAAGELEVRQARQQLASARSNLRDLEQQREVVRNQLAVLLGGQAWPRDDEPQTLESVTLPAIDPGVPARLLGRRPDLRAAELRLRASLAQLKATARSYYPALNLTGSLGSSSQALLDLLANPVATLGAGLSLPFLNIRQARLQTRIAGTDYQQAAKQFRTTLYTALSEVRNALSARRALADQVAAERQSLQDAKAIADIYATRYRNGAIPLRIWLDAQNTRRNAELALASKRREALTNYVALYQALGGVARSDRKSQ